MSDLGVLIVDDDFRVAGLHAAIVTALNGFRVTATAGSVAQARHALERHPDTDLVLLDVHLPDGSGIDLLGDLKTDCFIAGAETDADAVRRALRAGALTYLIKPFDDTELARRLAGYAHYRRTLAAEHVDQVAVDAALAAMRTGGRSAGRGGDGGSHTEQKILDQFTAGATMFADDVSTRVGVSPATARRYLASLVDSGRLSMSLHYGTTGRPRQVYRLPE